MVRRALPAVALALALGLAPLHAADRPPPPPIPIHETPIRAFSDAGFEFHLADLDAPVFVHIRMAPTPPDEKFRIGTMDMTYGSQSVSIGEDQLSDIPEPNLFWLRATAVVMPRDTVIALYLQGDSRACLGREKPSCGQVEFDWTVGGAVRKIDYRK